MTEVKQVRLKCVNLLKMTHSAIDSVYPDVFHSIYWSTVPNSTVYTSFDFNLFVIYISWRSSHLISEINFGSHGTTMLLNGSCFLCELLNNENDPSHGLKNLRWCSSYNGRMICFKFSIIFIKSHIAILFV